jgi:ABC-type transport system involved in cytochrome bd biosynthesis fused ATPase/permease subunit
MTEPQPGPSRSTASGGVPWQWQLVVAAVLLVVFLVIGVLMIVTADTSDAVWKNRVTIFSAFQSLVFGAVGWLFGREINRVPAEVARADAQEAKEQAQENAEEAAEARVRAATEETRGRALAAAVTSTAASTAAPTRESAGFERAGAAPTPQLAALAAMAEELYGHR